MASNVTPSIPGAPSFCLAIAYAARRVSILQTWTYSPQKRQDGSAFALTYSLRLQISEFPTGDFGSNRQAVSVETDRPFRSKAAPRCGWVLAPTLANRRCVIHPILLWPAQASTLVIISGYSDRCGRL